MTRRHVAVIGTGVSGLVAAHVLRSTHDVTVYEAKDRPGGHADSHDVVLTDGTPVVVDCGFIVHNDRTYPTLCRVFDELGVRTQRAEMSMSISGTPGWEYAGGKGPMGLLADPHTWSRPRYLRMLTDVKRFHRRAHALLAGDADGGCLGDWLGAQSFSRDFLEFFARPVVASVWSCPPEEAMAHPVRSLLTFLDHHGMLSVSGSPRWRTIVGGSRAYVRRLLDPIDDVRLDTPVLAVRRTDDGVVVHDDRGHASTFDAAVLATHPHQALAMRPDADALTTAVLGDLKYSANPAVLHTDTSILPRHARAQASWNYHTGSRGRVLVTYDLTRLQRLPSPGGQRILVTLNPGDRIDPRSVLDTMLYEHPLYTIDALAARRRLPEISDDVIAYAGAYHGWGFHEDGAVSGKQAAQALGGVW